MFKDVLLGDSHEPKEAEQWFKGVVDYQVRALNEQGYADYVWLDHEGKLVQVERKQWGEILSGLDKIEDQVRGHLSRQPNARTALLIEGVVVGITTGSNILKRSARNNFFVEGYQSSIRLHQVYSWLYQVSKYVEVYQTTDYYETCLALSAFFKSDQKAEHSTFQRYFKKIDFVMDPRVAQFMGVFSGVGEQRAKVLVEKFATLYNLLQASPKEIAQCSGIGEKLAITILRQGGRLDV